jgi:peptidoglycan/LPS O-acetylase OafA/YrhL
VGLNTERKHRFLALDGLRGVAAFAVVLYHFRWSNHLTGPFQNGYLAVDLFFILSGFVIYANYSALPDLRSALHFIWLRFFRVYPLHLAVLAAFVALNMAKLWAAHFGVISTQAPFSGSTSIHGLIGNLLLSSSRSPCVRLFNVQFSELEY